MRAAGNIEFGARQDRVDKRQRPSLFNDLRREVDLRIHREKLPNSLSGGQQQLVMLARALAMRPSVILLDEHLSNLDARLREEVRREICSLQWEFGFTMIYVTHD